MLSNITRAWLNGSRAVLEITTDATPAFAMTSFSTDRLCSDTSLFFAPDPNVIFGSPPSGFSFRIG